jgi:hypothetical protein
MGAGYSVNIFENKIMIDIMAFQEILFFYVELTVQIARIAVSGAKS